jgi:hypothetical protein
MQASGDCAPHQSVRARTHPTPTTAPSRPNRASSRRLDPTATAHAVAHGRLTKCSHRCSHRHRSPLDGCARIAVLTCSFSTGAHNFGPTAGSYGSVLDGQAPHIKGAGQRSDWTRSCGAPAAACDRHVLRRTGPGPPPFVRPHLTIDQKVGSMPVHGRARLKSRSSDTVGTSPPHLLTSRCATRRRATSSLERMSVPATPSWSQ